VNPLRSGDGLDLPLKIGSYRIETRLDAGGMGVVYRAFDEALQRPLAIKRLLADPNRPTASRRFRREAQAAARLNHPAIVHIYDIVETPEGDWIVMELVEGMPLGRLIRDGSLDLPHAVRLAKEIAEGLGEAHAHGIIHRDLKSSNVMVTATGHAKILDFGLAKFVHAETDQSDLSKAGTVLGTCHAMSPEQAQGLPLDHRSDLFSFGSLFYEMLTATSPFRAGTAAETLGRVCSFQQTPACRLRPEVPRAFSDLIDQLLCKDPDQRPGSAAEVVERLTALGTTQEEALEDESTFVDGPFVGGIAARHAAKPPSGLHPTSERRQVTVACCEPVGIDGKAFDPEALHELMLELRAQAEVVARRYDGQLESNPGGHRILICFGYPQIHEDNARRAVRAALELVDQVTGLSAGSEPERQIALRAGVHTGPAVVAVAPGQEPMTLGTTLDLAAELQSLAEPGCVIVSPATCSLIGKSFVLEALAPVEVRGLAAPLIPHRVLEPIESPEDSPAGLSPLVGREQEMELLLSRWALSRERNGQVILISGEAGIGKSRLVRAVRERLEQGTAQWWSCFASPYTQSSPLQPVIGLLRQVLLPREETSSLDQLERSLRDFALADAVPLFAPLLDLPLDERHPALPLSPERQREKTLEALTALVVEMAERQPLVVLIEDLHWLDPTTLSWLDHLIEQAPAAPLFLLLTRRLQPLEASWGARAHLTQINLNPLNDTEAERLIERVVGERSLPAAVRRQIVARTDGVPLFLEELTKAVLESPAADGQELPATLRDSLAARLDRLGTAKEIAQVASVIGRTFTFELLAAVCFSDEVALQRELRRLVQAELIYRKRIAGQARYLFKHALVQDAAYDSLLRRERQQIHRRIAETLEARFPETTETTPEILAHHYTEAGVIEPAIDFWVRAGAVASRRSASAETLNHLDRALQMLQRLVENPERDRRELKIQNARAAAIITLRGWVGPDVERTYARAVVLAERFEDAEEHFWAVLGFRTHHLIFGNLAQALPLSERLLQIAESERRPNLLSVAWFALGVYHFWSCEYAEAVSALERACELAPPGDDSFRLRTGTDLRVASLSYAALSLGHLGQLDRARHKAEQASALARQLDSPHTLAFACVFGGAVLAHKMRDVETVRQVVREVYDLSVELGLAHWACLASLLRAWSELQTPVNGGGGPPKVELGDVASVQRLIVQLAGSSMAWYFCTHAEILLLQGRPEDAWRVLDEGLRLAQARRVPFYREEIYRLQGEIMLAAPRPEDLREGGGPAEAERLFQMALEEARRKGSRLLELHAALSLGRFWKSQGRIQPVRELLAQAQQGFTGDSPDLREARTLLESCS